MMKSFEGVFITILTPFNRKKDINHESLENLVIFKEKPASSMLL